MDNWIKTKDQMPEDCKDVLLFTEDYGITIGHWNSGAPKETPWWVEHDWISGVTHWVPLPPAPTNQ
jgi:hypothetical protein